MPHSYGLPNPSDVASKTGRDGEVLAHGTSTMLVLGGK